MDAQLTGESGNSKDSGKWSSTVWRHSESASRVRRAFRGASGAGRNALRRAGGDAGSRAAASTSASWWSAAGVRVTRRPGVAAAGAFEMESEIAVLAAVMIKSPAPKH